MFEPGQWKAICDRCGKRVKARELRKEWNGLRVCSRCHWPRNPQDKLRARKDNQAPPWVRPEPDDIDVSPGSGNEVTPDDL